MRHRTLLPSILLAAGVIAATLLTKVADDSALPVLGGPVVLAGALLAGAGAALPLLVLPRRAHGRCG